MLRLGYSAELTWPERGPYRPIAWTTMRNPDAHPWLEQSAAGYAFGYTDLRDAQNNAARGDMNAIYAVHCFELFFLTEYLR